VREERQLSCRAAEIGGDGRALLPGSAPSDVECAVRLGPLGGDVGVEVQRRVCHLPFVVYVRRTAEILSKVVLLAGDHLMQYPRIREPLHV